MLKLQKNTAEYTILKSFSIARLLELKHHAPQSGPPENGPGTVPDGVTSKTTFAFELHAYAPGSDARMQTQ